MIVGDFTYGHENIIVRDFGEGAKVTIGKFCSIAANVEIFIGGNHRTDWITTYPFGHILQDRFPHHGQGHPATKGDVNIGNDVWIGRGATIMSGVTIGNGAVIAANAVVTKDVPHYTIAYGNPAKYKPRFKDPISGEFDAGIGEILNRIAWWDWDYEKIAQHIPQLCSDNIWDFIKAYTKQS